MVPSRTLGVLVAVLVALVVSGTLVFRGPAEESGHRLVVRGTPTVEADGLPPAEVSAAAVETGDLDRLMDVVLVTLLLGLGTAAASLGGLMGAEAVSSSRRWSVEALLGAPLPGLLKRQAMLWRGRLLGGLATGVVLAAGGVWALAWWAPPGIRLDAVSPFTVFAGALLTVMGLLIMALRPVGRLYRSRGRLAAALRAGGASESAAVRFQRTMLVTGQLAVAVALVAAAGLLRAADVGFRDPPETGEVSATLVATGDSARDSGLRGELLRAAWSRLRADPSLVAESLATPGAWLDRGPETTAANECGRCQTGGMPHPVHVARVRHHVVMPGFTSNRGLTLRDGRRLTADDGFGSDPVVLINEAYARAHFQDGPAVGKRLALGGLGGDWHRVVGVVSDVPVGGLGRSGSPFAVYFSALQHPPTAVELLARHVPAVDGLDLDAAVGAIQGALAPQGTRELSVDAVLPAADEVRRIHGTSAWLAVGTRLLGGVAAVAAILALWAAVAGHVRARSVELGTRAALGAGSRVLYALVLGEAARVGLVGVALGLWAATAVVGIVGPEGGPLFDWALFALVGSAFLAVTVCAAVPGARRAAHVEPAAALSGAAS